ncbi:extracellular solute-binding protein [Leptospira interrogans]
MRYTLTRRSLLGAAGTAALLPVASLQSAFAQAQTKVTFSGWAFEPQIVEDNVKLFNADNPDLDVIYTPLDLMLYNEKMVSLFSANSQPDVFYVRDSNFGAWVEAGWLRPIDGMPGLDELNKSMFPFNREAMFYKGKQYGLPYYGDPYIYMFDRTMLQKAGVEKPPVTLDQLKEASLAIKSAKLASYPILNGYKTNPNGLSEFWSLVFASGGRLFDDELNPVYADKDLTALGVLEWLVEAMHTWQILDPKGLELDETQARETYLSGQGAFSTNTALVLYRANNPALSKRAGNIDITRYPGLKDVNGGPMGWTRLYGMNTTTKVPDAAWRLMSYLGGKNKKGEYFTSKLWYLKHGIGYPYRELNDDADIQAAQRKGGYALEVLAQQLGAARARENIHAPWYAEWDRHLQQQIQRALLRQAPPRQALEASAQEARKLKKQG